MWIALAGMFFIHHQSLTHDHAMSANFKQEQLVSAALRNFVSAAFDFRQQLFLNFQSLGKRKYGAALTCCCWLAIAVCKVEPRFASQVERIKYLKGDTPRRQCKYRIKESLARTQSQVMKLWSAVINTAAKERCCQLLTRQYKVQLNIDIIIV